MSAGGEERPDLERDRNVMVIARMCHETNRAWCEANGDSSQVPWAEAEGWQVSSAVIGVDAALRGDSPAQLHEGWYAVKEADGWVYGAVKDPDAKTHPCMVPYEDLPAEQRVKDSLFRGVVHALAPTFGLEVEVPRVVPSPAECRAVALKALVAVAGDERTMDPDARTRAAEKLLFFADERLADGELVAEAVAAARAEANRVTAVFVSRLPVENGGPVRPRDMHVD